MVSQVVHEMNFAYDARVLSELGCGVFTVDAVRVDQ